MNSGPSHFDLVVIGGGSAGIGAALAGARSGLAVLLVEKADSLGGNAVHCGVHSWEPGVGGNVFPREIYERLRQIPLAVGIWSLGRHCAWPEKNRPSFPGGELLVDSERTYDETQKRHGTSGYADEATIRQQWHGVVFEPERYAEVVEQMVRESGGTIWKSATFQSVRSTAGRVESATIFHEGRPKEVRASHWIDATADALVCRSAGAECLIGEESADRFGEPGAPSEARPRSVNAVSLIFRITKVRSPQIEPAPVDLPNTCWFRSSWPMAHIVQLPNGDRSLNMLPTMEGAEFLDYVDSDPNGYRQAYAECELRVRAYWRDLQSRFPEFRSYRMSWIAPALGVRESRRVVGEYTLTQTDLEAGLAGQTHPDLIAIADHPMDVHGEGNRGCPELKQPYGIPLRCLIPRGWKNLLVAGRCASFSHLAASSCRLSRTMMDLGHAAGLAAAVAKQTGSMDAGEVRRRLAAQGAALSWPVRPQLIENSGR